MRTIIKSTSETFNKQSIDLTRALYGYRHFNIGIKRCFERFGYTMTNSGNHIKCYYGNRLVTTIASTPSDLNAGHQVLRYIRSFLERYEEEMRKKEERNVN